MAELLPASENWRCERGIYQRCQITWQTWDFSLFLSAWSLHQTKWWRWLRRDLWTACPLQDHLSGDHIPHSPSLSHLACYPGSPVTTVQCQPHIPAFSGQSSALHWANTGSFSASLGMLEQPEQLMQGSPGRFIPWPGMWEMSCLSPKYVSLKLWWWCTKVL